MLLNLQDPNFGLDFFLDVFNHKKEDKEKIVNTWFQSKFTWDAVAGKAKYGNLELYPEGVPYGTFKLPLVYLQNVNNFYPIMIEKIYSKWMNTDWLSFFSTDEKSDELNWKHRIFKFTAPEVIKSQFGTTHREVTFFEKTISGRSTFLGCAVKLPYDWGKGTVSRYSAQSIVYVSLLKMVEAITDAHKLLLMETVLNTEDQYYRYMIDYPGREKCGIDKILAPDFEMLGIFNKKKYAFPALIDIVEKRIRTYNPGYKTASYGNQEWCIIAPEEMHNLIINSDHNHENITKGHRNDGFYNKENTIKSKFYKIKGYNIYPLKEYKSTEYPNGINILSSYTQKILFNWVKEFWNLSNHKCPFIYDNKTTYIRCVKSKSDKPITFKKIFDNYNALYGNLVTNGTIKEAINIKFGIPSADDSTIDDILLRSMKNPNERAKYYGSMLENIVHVNCIKYGITLKEFMVNLKRGINSKTLVFISDDDFPHNTDGTSEIKTNLQYGNGTVHFFTPVSILYGKYVSVFFDTIEDMHTLMVTETESAVRYISSLRILINFVMGGRVNFDPRARDSYHTFITSFTKIWGNIAHIDLYAGWSYLPQWVHSMLDQNGVPVGNWTRWYGPHGAQTIYHDNQGARARGRDTIARFGGNMEGYVLTVASIQTLIDHNIPLPFPLGMVRETILETNSIIFAAKSSISLVTGPRFTEFINDPVSKNYYVDTDGAYGVKVLDDTNYYLAKDVHISGIHPKAIPHHYFVTRELLTNKTSPTGGGIIPIILGYDELRGIKNGFFPKSGKYEDFWNSIVIDDKLERDYKMCPIMAKFSDKYKSRKYRKEYIYYRYKDYPGMFRTDDFCFQAYQKSFDPNNGEYTLESGAFGHFKGVFESTTPVSTTIKIQDY